MYLCGEIHYFRVPRELWEDRLLKLKRAGLNCLSTYFAWNYHEIEPGIFDFSGEKDVDTYLTQAERLGLKIAARVGPYICSEWDNGGHPDWLLKKGFIPRSLDPSYWTYAERWLRSILPYVVKHQEPMGGVAILQLENEAGWGDVPYHMRLADLARQVGVTAKLYANSNRYVRNTVFTEAVDLYPGRWDIGSVITSLKDLVETQGGNPKILEYEGGWGPWINGPKPSEKDSLPPEWIKMLFATALAYGTDLINFYMFHGGTNMGNWPGRWIPTRYSWEASVMESGELSDMYYKLKLLTPLAELLDGSETESEKYDGGRLLVIRRKGDLRLKFYVNNTDSEWADGEIRLKPREVKVIPLNLSVKGATIRESNLNLLGVIGGDVLLYGDVGEAFSVRLVGVNIKSCGALEVIREGEEVVIKGNVPEELTGCLVDAKGTFRILILSEEFASKTWVLNDLYVPSNAYLLREGNMSRLKLEAKEGKNVLYIPFASSTGDYVPETNMSRVEIDVGADEPQLITSQPKQGPVSAKPVLKLKGIRPLEELGLFAHDIYEYDFDVSAAALVGFVVHDLAVIINNGKVVGSGLVYVKCQIEPGELRVIVHSTGHPNDGQLPSVTGLLSPALLNLRDTFEISSWEYGLMDFSTSYKPGVPTNHSRTITLNRDAVEYLPKVNWVKSLTELGKPSAAVFYYRATVDVGEGGHLVIRLSKSPALFPILIFVDGDLVYKGIGDNPIETVVYAGFRKGQVQIAMASITYPHWSLKDIPNSPGETHVEVWDGAADEAVIKKIERGCQAEEELPTPISISDPKEISFSFSTRKLDNVNAPVYLELRGDAFAFIYLNGKLVGKYFPMGPQERFYLPEPYLRQENEVSLLCVPTKQSSRVEFKVGYYYKTKLIDIDL
ncbi:MAG: glycoside hydrolase family 35 protein [Thermoprotei archaeon]